MIKVIFAQGINGEFSKKGEMPWGVMPLAGDSKHFQNYTRDAVVVMGSGTWKSLPTALRGRVNVVLTNNPALLDYQHGTKMPTMTAKGSLEQVIPELQVNYPTKDIIIIGGKKLIEEAIGYADEVSITTSDFGYEGCVSFDKSFIYGKMNAHNLKLYSTARYNNEGFGLGENIEIKVYRKVTRKPLTA